MFRDRAEAGRKLAQKLLRYANANALVLALPRGGVVVGFEIARALNLPLDIVAVRKIGHPNSPEYAIGAVDESGERILNEEEAHGVNSGWLAAETERELKEAKRRSAVYRGGRPQAKVEGKVVILVDDGIATGLTMRLAVRSVKAQKPQKILVAVPVAPADSASRLSEEGADELIVLEPPENFAGAVGAHYVRFDQTSDGEVGRLLSTPPKV